LELGEDAGACSDFSTGWPGIAVPPGSAHPLTGVTLIEEESVEVGLIDYTVIQLHSVKISSVGYSVLLTTSRLAKLSIEGIFYHYFAARFYMMQIANRNFE
jgi:hypothetical protein